MVKLAKAASKQAAPKAPPPEEEVDEGGEEQEDAPLEEEPTADEFDEANLAKDDDDDDEEEEEEEEEDESEVKAMDELEGEEEEGDEDDNNGEEAAESPSKRKADSTDDTPPAKKSKTAAGFCLFVGNLNTNKTLLEIKVALKEFFCKDNNIDCGDIRLRDSKKCGYVDFAKEEDLEKALELNGKMVLGQEIRLEKARTKDFTIEARKERNARTLFAKNLPFSVTIEELKEVFTDAVDFRLPPGQKNRGIAYIVFESEEVAEKVMETAQGKDVQGRSVVLDYVGEKSQKGGKGQFKTLFVKGLSEDTTEETLKDAFECAVSARIVTDRDTGVSKGFGFVEFDSEDDCKAAKEAMEDGEAEIDGIKVTLDFAKPKNEFRGSSRGGFGRGGRGGGYGFGGGYGSGFGFRGFGRGGGGPGGFRGHWGGQRGGSRGGPRGGFGGGGGFGGRRGGRGGWYGNSEQFYY